MLCTTAKKGITITIPLQKKQLLLLGEGLDKQVEDYIKYLHECSTAVNTAVVIAANEGIIMNNLLSCNGGAFI